MLIRIAPLLFLSAPLAAPAAAASDIVADLPVTGALVGAVTGNSVTVLVSGDTDPHHVALRPSEARDMAAADLVVLIEGIAPAYTEAAETLASRTLILESSADHGDDHAPDHDVDHGDGHSDGHDHDHNQDHAAADHEDHDSAMQGDDDHADHGPAHAWLNPAEAVEWLDDIADALTALTPSLEQTYRTNAADARAAIKQSAQQAQARLAEAPPAPFLAVHDAWESAVGAFGIPVAAAVSDSHAARPGARHLREVEALIAEGAVGCLLAAESETLGFAERFDLPVVTLPLIGVSDAEGLAGYTGLIDALGNLGTACPQG